MIKNLNKYNKKLNQFKKLETNLYRLNMLSFLNAIYSVLTIFILITTIIENYAPSNIYFLSWTFIYFFYYAFEVLFKFKNNIPNISVTLILIKGFLFSGIINILMVIIQPELYEKYGKVISLLSISFVIVVLFFELLVRVPRTKKIEQQIKKINILETKKEVNNFFLNIKSIEEAEYYQLIIEKENYFELKFNNDYRLYELLKEKGYSGLNTYNMEKLKTEMNKNIIENL